MIFKDSLRFLGRAPALGGNKIRRSVSEGPLAISGCSTAIDISNEFRFFEVHVTATWIVFPLRISVFHRCTRSVLALGGVMVVILGCDGWTKYVVTRMEARAGCDVLGARCGCGVVFPTACCLRVCLAAAAATISGSKIRGGGLQSLEGLM